MKTRKLTMTALFAALVCVATTFIHLPVPMTGGYVHIGDAFIYLAATMLPMPYAMAAGAIGAGLADAFGGYVVYILPTAIIKALLVLPFTDKGDKIISFRTLIASIVASILGVAGYFVADWIIYANTITALTNMLVGMVQPFSSIVVFVALGYALDKSNIKKRFNLN